MKAIFNGIPTIKTVRLLMFTTVFSILHCTWSWLVSWFVGKTFEDSLMQIVLIIIVFITTWELTEYVGDTWTELAMEEIENEVSQYYLNKLYTLKPSVLKKSNTGYISGVVQKLVTHQENAYKEIVISLPITIIYMIYFGVITYQYHYMFCILFISVFVVSTLTRIILNVYFVTAKAEELADAEGNRNKLVIDLISNINTIQKMNALKYMNIKMKQVKERAMKACRDWVIIDEVGFISFKLITLFFIPLSYAWIYFSGNTHFMEDISFQSLLCAIGIQQLHNTRAIVNTLKTYTRFRGTLAKLNFTEDINNVRRVLVNKKFDNLVAKDISYTYVETIDGEDVSHHINIPEFVVNAGDFVCISGESGQGKTTLLDLISGQIETDNVWINDISKIRLDCVFISQDTEVFDMSLRDNLTLGKDIDDSSLYEMLEAVGLSEWIDSLELGFDTMLGERGVFVSTGQRQRINLIRGLLITDKDVYLLDEPTSNVDNETELKMIDLISKKLAGKTVVIVSHRMKISEICNKHYEFTDGTLYVKQEV